MKQLSESKIEAMDTLLEAIKTDYERWSNRRPNDGYGDIKDKMVEEFNENLAYTVGSKYIKVMSKRSVWGFIVNTENDKKFQDGDLLMAASWAAPARNFPRANIFKEYAVRWAGA